MLTKTTTKESKQLDADLKRARDEFDYDFRKWEPIYKEGDIDVRYRAGQPWEAKDKQARDDAGRPALAFDELSQYLNQAVNDVRANPVSPKFSPTGDGANDDTARFYESLDRETEYRSNAQIAYTTAYENGLERSYGFIRMKTEFEHPKSFAQQIAIEPLANPSCWYPDADAMKPDGKDWKRGSYIEKYTREEFKRSFPRATYKDFSREQISTIGASWGNEDGVQVAERWEVNMTEGVLVQYEVPGTMMRPPQVVEIIEGVDRKPRNGREIQRRATEYPKVRSCFTTGLEILTQADGKTWQPWMGDSIPFASCYGKILWMNQSGTAERNILSMTRLARSPYMAYCFAVTSIIEAIGMITKNPYFAYEGTLDAKQLEAIAESLHQPVAVLFSKPFVQNNMQVLMPLLQRNPLSVDLSSYVATAEMCRRAIQAAMGWTPLPTQAQRHNEKSGIALQRIEESGQRGSYHFKDAYYSMLRRGAEIRENLYDRIYDTPRDVNVRGRDQTPEQWRINDPKAQGERVMKSIKGRHSVTIDVGPEMASEREAAEKFLDAFIASPLLGILEPQKRDKLIALAIKARNIGIMGDKMADIISPPENKSGQPDPAQALALLKQAQEQIIPALQQQIQQMEAEKAAKVTETEGKLAITAAADATKVKIAEMQDQGKARDTGTQSTTAIEIQDMKDAIAELGLMLKAQIEGAKLAQQTALAERGHEQGERDADKQRAVTLTEGQANRDAARSAAQRETE